MIPESELEFHAWPSKTLGVLVIHRPTGYAAVSIDARSQLSNKTKALAQLAGVVAWVESGDAEP